MKYLSVVQKIALNYVQELIRNRFVLILVFVSFGILVISSFLGALSIGERLRMTVDFGILAIHISNLSLCIFLGSLAINSEIERKTCWLILSGPVSRTQFYLGKFIGILTLSTFMLLILFTLLSALVGFGPKIYNLFLIAVGIWIESTILISIVMFFSQWMYSATSIFIGYSVFLIGNWMQELSFFGEKLRSEVYLLTAEVLNWMLPHFYRMNFRTVYFFENGVSLSVISWSFFHLFGWVGLMMTMGILFFKRRDLV